MSARPWIFEKLPNKEKTQINRISAALRHRGFGDAMCEAAEAHHTTVEEMLARGRTPCAVRARWALFALMSEAGLSSAEIGRLVEMDHTTVLAGLKGGKGRAT